MSLMLSIGFYLTSSILDVLLYVSLAVIGPGEAKDVLILDSCLKELCKAYRMQKHIDISKLK